MRTAWKHIRRTPYQALAAVFIVSLTFFVATILFVLTYGLSQTLKHYETRPQVIAYIKNEATSDQVQALQKKLEEDSRIKGVRYVSKEDALGIYKQATADDPLLSEFVSPSVFQVSLEFSLTNLSFAQDVIDELKKNNLVSDVDFTATLDNNPQSLSQVINRLKTISTYVQLGGGAIVGFLLFSSFLVLLLIIGMRISARRDEIEILQLLGATPGFIRGPFLLEGLAYGFFGALMGWVVALLLLLYISPYIVAFFQDVPFLPADLPHLLLLTGVVLTADVLVASFLGLFGSFMAIKRYLGK